MALSVTGDFNTPFGTTANPTYHRWVQLNISVPDQQAYCVLYSYVNEAAFNSGKQPIGQRSYTITGSDFATLANALDGAEPTALSEVVYSYVQANDDYFADAVNV